MRIHVFETSLVLPGAPPDIFPFFADAGNLDAITPPWLHFQILTPLPIDMRQGTLIDYQIRIRGVKVRWKTRISVWAPPFGFVDEQLKGPYRRWVHTHMFEAVAGGTLCSDRVEYAHAGGDLIHRFFVRPEIERIFAHRQRRLRELLAHPSPSHVRPATSLPVDSLR